LSPSITSLIEESTNEYLDALAEHMGDLSIGCPVIMVPMDHDQLPQAGGTPITQVQAHTHTHTHIYTYEELEV
jgi:hypothetical protein